MVNGCSKIRHSAILEVQKATKGQDPITGRFVKGNKVWKSRSKHGRHPIFANAEELLNACHRYFQWVADNPLCEYKVVGMWRGEVVTATLHKMRPMTICGLCLFLGMSKVTWFEYRKKSTDFSNVCSVIENIMWEQKFAGVAAGIFNHAIIARDLGLAHRQEVTFL